MIIYQGNTYNIPVKLIFNGETVTSENVKTVEFAIKDQSVTYPENATYKDEYFTFTLSQENTFALPQGIAEYQLRIKFNDGSVKCTEKGRIEVRGSVSKEVLV